MTLYRAKEGTGCRIPVHFCALITVQSNLTGEPYIHIQKRAFLHLYRFAAKLYNGAEDSQSGLILRLSTEGASSLVAFFISLSASSSFRLMAGPYAVLKGFAPQSPAADNNVNVQR